jgi:uncharacterized protein (DUF1810 family)
MAGDPYNLERFVQAQSGGVFNRALAELAAGRKQSHWMWFVFPQHRDLGRSATAKFYGLSGVAEARAYIHHPLLGPRLRQCCEAILPHLEAGGTAAGILGQVDAMKLKSSMEVFGQADPGEELFAEVLTLL